MKKIITVFLSVFIGACTEEKANLISAKVDEIKFDTLNIGAKTYFFQNLIDSSFNFKNIPGLNDSENITINKHKNAVSRNGDSLFLICDNGKIIKLVSNKKDGDEYKVFSFLDLNEAINHYVIICSYVEGRNFLLVNKTNGLPLESISYPISSPNQNYFVCGNCDLIAGFDVNGISIYQKNKSNYELKGLRVLSNWGPEKMLWLNDTSLVIKANQLKADGTTLEIKYKQLYIK